MANLAYIQITRNCNQECRFCSNPPNGKVISFENAKSLINTFIKTGYEGLILSGGEPTLHPDLCKLIAYATEFNFPVRIITNGQKTADRSFMDALVTAGLKHIALSVYSDDALVQNFLTNNNSSLLNIKRTLKNIGETEIRADILIVINKYNADHLSRTVKWLVRDYPFLRHFVWNNIDPSTNRASVNKDTIPRLNDFELELNKAMNFLKENNKTFRVERVPLCYMPDFAHCSTETRKIVKKEKRMIYFLDEKEMTYQKTWDYGKAACCRVCSLDQICAGLYQIDKYFSSGELYPVFVSKDEIIKRVLSDG